MEILKNSDTWRYSFPIVVTETKHCLRRALSALTSSLTLQSFNMSAFAPHKSMHDVSQVEISESKMKTDQRYNALRNLDNESDSSTEVGDWDAEDLERSRQTKTRSRWSGMKRYRWLLDTGLLLVIIGLLVEKRWAHNHGHHYEFAGDITGFAPKCRRQRGQPGHQTDTMQFHSRSPPSNQTQSLLRRTHLTSGTRMSDKRG